MRITTPEIKELLSGYQGKTISLAEIRKEKNILPGTESFDAVRNIMFQLTEQRVVRPDGRKQGVYKVIEQVKQVQVYGTTRERRPPFTLYFPRDFTTEMEMSFAEFVVLRAGDLISIGGQKSSGKTTFVLNLCAENIDAKPVLMGNEYTIQTDNGYEPSPRFIDRLDRMKAWVEWTNGDGQDKFTLLPVWDDYAEHVIAGRINLIDWINLEGDRLFDISKVLSNIKSRNGKGITVAVLQKGENVRGGQFVRDFSDLEILLDPFGNNPYDVLLTIKGCKESTKPIVGKIYAYTIGEGGTKIFNFREVKKCPGCMGNGNYRGHECEECLGVGWRDR